MNANSQEKTRRLAGLALFTALIVILQLLGSFIRFGPVSVSLVALPIVVGAAVYGSAAGLWLGFVFGMVVLLSGDAAAFFAFSVPGTLLTVLVKGIACGGLAGTALGGSMAGYRLLKSLGHHCTKLRPALVQLAYFCSAAGSSLCRCSLIWRRTSASAITWAGL